MDEKLQKILANAGKGSRRAMEQAIADGRVSVNGAVAKLGDRAGADAKISLDGKPVLRDAEPQTRVIVYNKPEGEVSTRHDPEGRATIFDRLPLLKSGRWISIGRLDINTSGLLLFTNDGELANKMMHPSSNIDREYLVRVMGKVDEDMLKRLRAGVMLEDGPAKFTDIQIVESEREEAMNRWFYVALMEGRNREVRRLWESQGVQVNRLKRVRYGPVFIPSHITSGHWFELDPRDVDILCSDVGIERNRQKPLTQKERSKRVRQHKRMRKQASLKGRRG